MDKKAIGDKLRRLRGDKTLDEVARDLGVTPMAISYWERGIRMPSDPMKVKIAQYYGQTVEAIFFAIEVLN